MVTLLKDYDVCKEGDVLTPEQARILVSSPVDPINCKQEVLFSTKSAHLLFGSQKLFAIEMAEFRVQIKCVWNSETGEFENVAGEEEPAQDNEEEEDDDVE